MKNDKSRRQHLEYAGQKYTKKDAATEKRCYSVQELQEILGISRPTVYELLKKKEFRWIMIGGKYRISKQSFDNWLDKADAFSPE